MNRLSWESDSDVDVHILGTKGREYADLVPGSPGLGYFITLMIDPSTGRYWSRKKAKEFVSKLYNVKE